MTAADAFDPSDRFDDCRPEMMPDLPDEREVDVDDDYAEPFSEYLR